MDFTGRIQSVSKDLSTGKNVIALTVNEDAAGAYALSDCDVDLRIKKHRDKRSLDANAYYWTLLTKLAKVLEISNPEAHNMELQKYGQIERVEGRLVAVPLPDNDEILSTVRNKTEYHLCPTSEVTTMKGVIHRVYILMRGSSTYTAEEMARLIDGLITDCRDAGIQDYDIMTPFERQKLKEQYGIE